MLVEAQKRSIDFVFLFQHSLDWLHRHQHNRGGRIPVCESRQELLSSAPSKKATNDEGSHWHSKIFRGINRHSITPLCRLRGEEWVKSPLREKSFYHVNWLIAYQHHSLLFYFSMPMLPSSSTSFRSPHNSMLWRIKKVGKKRRTTLQTLLKYRHDAHSKVSFDEDFHNSSSSISLHVCVREKKLSTHHNTRRYRLSMRQCHRHTHASLKWIFSKKKRKKLRTPHHIKILCYVLQAIQLLFGYFVGR